MCVIVINGGICRTSTVLHLLCLQHNDIIITLFSEVMTWLSFYIPCVYWCVLPTIVDNNNSYDTRTCGEGVSDVMSMAMTDMMIAIVKTMSSTSFGLKMLVCCYKRWIKGCFNQLRWAGMALNCLSFCVSFSSVYCKSESVKLKIKGEGQGQT
jgi:hypothetical protein